LIAHHRDCPKGLYPDTGICQCHQYMSSYQADALRTIGPEIEDVEMMALVMLNSEAGELAGLIQKERWQGHPRNNEKILREGGDILWALTVFMYTCGFTLADVARGNMDKRLVRYPNGFTKERSQNRPPDDT
jgi:NTP pyrophosphatase (non-canonical NTP hydrolase)